jgi:hypothetical protein
MANNGTQSLKVVVESYQQLQVDDYQRTYAWSKDELIDLFSDLTDAVHDGEPHFFGTLILQNFDGNKAKVVDGQQRLTSVFLFVSAIRDELIALTNQTLQAPGQLPVNVLQKANAFLYPGQALAVHRFVPNRFLRQIFEESVMALPGSQVPVAKRGRTLTLQFRKAISAVREIIGQEFAKFTVESERLEHINKVLDTLLTSFNVLCVPTNSLSESLDIFLTMNNRGTPLGPSDLVRGEVMGHLTDGEPELVQRQIFGNIFQQWDTIAENVKEPEVFLRHYLVSTTEEKIQKKKVLDTISRTISGTTQGERKAKAEIFWNGILSDSAAYSETINPPENKDWFYSAYLLSGLLKSHRILLMRIIPSGFTEDQKTELIRLVKVLSYRWVMTYKNKQTLEDFFQKVCTKMREGADFQTIAAMLSEEADFHVDVKGYLTQEGDAGYVGKSILHAIDRVTNPNANFQELDSDVHLEHIAPQSRIAHWDAKLLVPDAISEDDYASLVAPIGNLTLLEKKLNIPAAQRPFSEKQADYYSNSVFKISDDLQQINDWDQDEIELRTDWIVETFNYVFSLQKPTQVPAKYSVWRAVKVSGN